MGGVKRNKGETNKHNVYRKQDREHILGKSPFSIQFVCLHTRSPCYRSLLFCSTSISILVLPCPSSTREEGCIFLTSKPLDLVSVDAKKVGPGILDAWPALPSVLLVSSSSNTFLIASNNIRSASSRLDASAQLRSSNIWTILSTTPPPPMQHIGSTIWTMPDGSIRYNRQ